MPNTDILNKTWTLPGSEEKLAEETFNDLPASYENNNITQNISADYLISNSFHNNGHKQIELSMKSSNTSFNLSLKSTTFVKEDQYMPEFRSLNLNIQQNFIDIDNMFKNICSIECISLFDENTNGLEFENGEPIKETTNLPNTNNLTVNINDTTVNINDKPNSSNTYSAQILQINEDPILTTDIIKPSKMIDKISIPNSFDTFVDDLKQSSNIILDSPTEKHTFNLLNTNLKMMTSSIDKDLNKESSKDLVKNRLLNRTMMKNMNDNSHTNLVTNKNLTSSNFDLDEIKETSSPFKILEEKINMNQSYTIDINQRTTQSTKNNENHNHSKDQIEPKYQFENYSDNQAESLNEEDLPRTVFNQTYTSWVTSEEQLEMAAFKQQKAMENKTTTHNNTTHNLKENFKFFDIQPATNLNKTMDIIDDNDLDDLPQIDITENLNKTREIFEEEIVDKPQISVDLELKNNSTNPKRVSLISSSGFIRPNISSNEKLNVSPSISSGSKLPSKLTPPSQIRSPIKSQIIHDFEFKKPAVPSPPKLASISRLPTSSHSAKTSIPKPSLSKPGIIQKSKTLGINTTSNIIKPSASLPFQKITQNTITDKRVTISSSQRLVSSVQSAKENNCTRLSYSTKPLGLANKTNIRGSTTGNMKTVKINSMSNSKMIPPQIPKSTKISCLNELKNETKNTLIPAFKTSLPVSRLSTISKNKK